MTVHVTPRVGFSLARYTLKIKGYPVWPAVGLWRYDPTDSSCVVVDEGPFTVCYSVPHPLRIVDLQDSNGLGWSPDEKTLYFTDSKTNIIYAYDYDDGTISNRRIFADAREQGLSDLTFADGLCIDSEGGVWSARWDGSQIIRFARDGSIDAEIFFRRFSG